MASLHLPVAGMRRRIGWFVGAVGAIVAAAILLSVLRSPATRSGASLPIGLPAPTAGHDDPLVNVQDFIGATACGECHPREHDRWRRSTHGRAGGAPDSTELLARFDGRPIVFRDAVVRPVVQPDGSHAFEVNQDGHPSRLFQVDGVIGGGHLVGGGTQGFVSRYADGTIRFLPFEAIRREGVWFCNTNSRAGRGWQPITKALALADCGDWPPVRILGSHARFANCQQCHGSQIQLEFDLARRRYETRITSYSINCESCHGPGARHVEWARAGTSDADPSIAALSIQVDKDASLGVCFQCHALKDQLEPGYYPGRPLEAHFSLKLPHLGDRPYHPDGRVRTFGYQQGHLSSACYRQGSLTCVDCHAPHSGQYRDVSGRTLPSRFDDGQCTGCHASKAEDPSRHTRHPPRSTGSRCVSCHMPYLQQPEVGTALGYTRSDHTIAIPRPRFDARLGIVGACQQCHADRTVEQLAAQSADWYGALKPLRPLVRRLADANTLRGARAVASHLLEVDSTELTNPNEAMAVAAALSRVLVEDLAPDASTLAERSADRLQTLADHPNLDVRALALTVLHLDRGHEPARRRVLADALRAAAPGDGPLRARWAVALGFVGDRHRSRGNYQLAIAAYRKGLEVLPGNPRILASLATAHRDAGDALAAEQRYRESLAQDSTDALTWINLGVTLAREGDQGGAAAAYRRAIQINPLEPLAHFNVGNAWWRQRDIAGAVAAYERAAALDPSLAAAQFQLARAYIAAGRVADALGPARRAVEFDSENETARAMLRELEQAAGAQH